MQSSYVVFLLFYYLHSILFITVCDGKITTGILQTNQNWHFLTRFCFLSKNGRVHFHVNYPVSYGVQSLLLYYDDDSQWPAVYKNESKDCQARRAVLNPVNFQIIDLKELGSWSGCHIINSTYYCDTERAFHSARERWWYVALSNCETSPTKGMYLNYSILMTNGDPDDTFFYHFSADEFYIIQTDITFFLLTMVVLILSIYIASVLVARQMYHTTFKLYVFSLMLELIHLMVMCCANGQYASQGQKNLAIEYLGRALRGASELSFVLMLILLAKGLTITRGRLRTASVIKICVFMTSYTTLYVSVFLWEAHFFDAGLVLYRYESPPGYCLIAIRTLGWLWFTCAVGFTLKHYPEKRAFYLPFYTLYTIWFLAEPAMIIIAMRLMELWVREKVVNAVANCVAFCGFMFFLVLTRPSAANKNFPYHVRTTQIAALIDDVNSADGSVTYSPESERQVNFTDLFVVAKPEQKSIHIDRFPHAPTANSLWLPGSALDMPD